MTMALCLLLGAFAAWSAIGLIAHTAGRLIHHERDLPSLCIGVGAGMLAITDLTYLLATHAL